MTLLRVNELTLIGGGRTIEFNSGLSIVRGQITTGKTTLGRLFGGLFGAMPGKLPPEFKSISALSAQVTIGRQDWRILRPRTSTTTAKVDISGPEIERLPAQVLDGSAELTYQQWLMRKLGIPEVVVPGRRSDPEYNSSSPVTINDWMNYCIVPGPEIDTMVFGHKKMGVSEKRRWVFDINYGLYDPETARLQAILREVEAELQGLRQQDAALRSFFQGTPLENEEDLRATAGRLEELLASIDGEGASIARMSAEHPTTSSVRSSLLAVRRRATETRRASDDLAAQLTDLQDLVEQLRAQSRRLTRAILAEDYLVDFDFVVCPRCGQDVDHRHAPDQSCTLCLQPLDTSGDNRRVLIAEQDRISAQIAETEDVVRGRASELEEVNQRLAALQDEEDRLAAELDRLTDTFVSDRASTLEALASQRAQVVADRERIDSYLQLLSRRANAHVRAEELQDQKAELLAELDQSLGTAEESDRLIREVETRMLEYLRALEPPIIGDALVAYLDKRTRLPVVGGRSFDALSSQGLSVLVNIAHALAHHTVSVDHDLALPGFLVLDGISSNTGREGWDAQREENAFKLIARVADQYRDRMQVIVLDNNAPSWLEDHVVLDLTQEDRLVRTHT